MYIQAVQILGDRFKKTKFWRNNYLILREFKNFRKVAILALVFSFIAATFEGFSIGFLLSFLQNLTTPDAEPMRTGITWFDTWILATHSSAVSRLYRISLLILLSTWIRAVFNYLAQVYTEVSQLLLADRLRKQIFQQLQCLPLSYFAKTRSGEIINTITTEIDRMKQWFSGAAFLITRGITAFIYFISMCLLSWQLTIISFLLFTLLGVGLSTVNARARETSFSTSIANGQFTSIAIELVNAIRTIQAFSTQEFERQRFYNASDKVVSTSTKVVLTWSLVRPLAEAVASTILIGMIIFAFTVFVVNGTLQVASLLTFFFVLFRVVPIVQDINGTRAHLSTLQGAADNIQNLISTENKTYLQNGYLKFTGLQHSIDIVSVDFGYEPNTLVLNNITLSIEKGKTTALVGGTGAGKSTLIDLIPRFYDPIAGNVLIDGVDIRKFDMKSLREKIAVVSQDTFIFNTSVRNNISYGTKGATEAEIRKVARLANALEFIEEMPEGLNTQLGDRGVRLSGGQRQRLAIARALLRDPEILILDEATSALDSVTERLIQESIEKLSVGRTVIAIAHRLSTIAQANKVVVLEQGRIIEQGNYQELLELKGKLWEYHKTQYEIGQAG
ncbi:heterocyst formation ABC transporter subunit HepA [Umezakia ovalisporum]|jgi:subfamily B ATP-binding cassette protein MsbA|uniref:ABC transporter ATP-binding protein/permease n=2 Tax=Umezakia ovalisporum TaxID=75695 RepID=A0AA43H0E2_9CYAN|nr:heterocyst formation ABC transporter subunit HepA [Umezakia ovalisporum]MDH6057174.1 ABC transporter ATP-binding protein/permease [Umezakia ovalisporum FSS-43]MDH6064622.1 ABC transporter ATP-binding protein/permease [Umezakia ovalisporum FSS-62]MDH6069024.1 ABC transporter ATP-binding protein/permease [Umezakia ovalisporum APH033B]MDH6071714.1 ABC transporter ATP-binding protein/permease [Umezakia ovalisporum CobakiLakeA]MDH6073398.1 ABC transporter ATP-binding protein/permease [Umezakia o